MIENKTSIMDTDNLDRYIRRCKEGSMEDFRALLHVFQPMVYSLTMKMLGNEQEAEEALQDTFVRVWQNIGRYDAGKGKFSTWVYAIASRICLDRLKHHQPQAVSTDDESVFRQYASAADPERQLMDKDWNSIVRLLAARLSAKQRLVFTLCLIEGLPTDEVKAITGMTSGQVKSNLYVARQHIVEQLKRLGYGR